jgi:glycosyltransferase involved in cell wall biosynthesis
MAVWEAMSMNLPIVSTDVGDVRHILQVSGAGFCVPVDGLDALTEKVAALIQDASMRQTMGKKARDFAMTNLDLKICAERHACFYRAITNASEFDNC